MLRYDWCAVSPRLRTYGWRGQSRITGSTSVNATLFAKKAKLNRTVQTAHIKALEKSHRQVSDALRRLQGVRHSRGRPIAHAREPVPRHSAETSSAVLHRKRRLQRFVRQESVSRQEQRQSTSSQCTWMGDRYPPNLSQPNVVDDPLHQELQEPVHLDR